MHRIVLPPDFGAWRDAARDLLQRGFTPEELDLEDATAPRSLDLLSIEDGPHGRPMSQPHVPRTFIQAAETAAAHRDPERWNLLYRLLYRLQLDRELLRHELDADVAELRRLNAQVKRDLHKMHAFVRFRRVLEHAPVLADGTPEEAEDREHFIAWYRPDHRILPLAAPFFAERFAVMRWTILTPDASVSWDPDSRRFLWSEGVGRESDPSLKSDDELEGLWQSYYKSIFNPARLNTGAMRSEMPMRYWSNLPELQQLPQLIEQAGARVSDMVTRQSKQPTALPYVPAEHALPVLNAAMPECRGCDLYLHATQVVPGAGAAHAALLMVGEQPGDQEDRRGEPFVGPAGAVLRKALEELKIAPAEVYMTNAVKHFKFVQRGKVRIHQNPRMGEITACRPWLTAEIDAIKPKVILCLGASAAKSLLGGTFALMKQRGTVQSTSFAERVIATVHPSAVLRAPDDLMREQLYGWMRDDIALAWQTAQHVG